MRVLLPLFASLLDCDRKSTCTNHVKYYAIMWPCGYENDWSLPASRGQYCLISPSLLLCVCVCVPSSESCPIWPSSLDQYCNLCLQGNEYNTPVHQMEWRSDGNTSQPISVQLGICHVRKWCPMFPLYSMWVKTGLHYMQQGEKVGLSLSLRAFVQSEISTIMGIN